MHVCMCVYGAVGWLKMGGFFKAKVELSATETTPSIFCTYMSNTINARTHGQSILKDNKTLKYK